jgi:hypothetical protein
MLDNGASVLFPSCNTILVKPQTFGRMNEKERLKVSQVLEAKHM